MELFYTAKFRREYKKLPLSIQIKAEKREKIFLIKPYSPVLKTHKLKGELQDFWSFSVDFSYRIIFEFKEDGKIVVFHSIGNHDIYK